jgi:hypothetical protein
MLPDEYMMTAFDPDVKEAFDKVTTLPETLQDQIAHEVLEEIEWESSWNEPLSESQNVLDGLAQKAMSEFDSGKTHELGFDDL